MPTVQEMVAKKVAENKAESLAKKSVVSPVAPTTAPINQVTSTDATKTQGTNNITFGAPAKAPVPVSTPTSVSQGVTTPTPVAQTPIKVPTAPKVIGEQNGVVQYEKQQVTTPIQGVTGTNLNLPTAKGTQDNLQYSFDVKDPMNYMGTGMTQEQFKTLPLETQSAYTNAALANEQQKVGIIKQTQYAQDLKAQEELMKKQNAIKVENDRLSMENQAVQDNASVAKAQQDLATLKQNIGFLGQGGRPVQSQQVVDSYDRMLATSNQQYKDMVQIANNMRQMRENGIQFDENAYNAQLDQIHNDLKRNVDSVIQQAINGFSSDQIAGMIDSPESLQKLQNKYLDMIDTSVMGMTNRSIANLQTMQEVYKGRIADAQQQYKAYQESMQQYQAQQAEQQATFQKNQNTLNKDMSSALGYYVDGNGNPLMSSEGTTIAFKKDMPAPIFDRESGVMVTFEPDANGNPVGITKQIMQPSQSTKLEQQYKLLQMQKLQQDMQTSDKTLKVTNPDGTESIKQYNVNTGRYDIDVTGSSPIAQDIQNPQTMQQIAEFCTSNRGRSTVQCGELVNDYIKMATGTKGGLGDSFNDKVKAIENMGRSPSPVEGGVFAFDVKTSQGNTGHTGIVTKVNDDGSIEVLEANRKENSAKGGVPTTDTYTAEQVKNMIFSVPPKTKEASQERQLQSRKANALVMGIGGTEGERKQAVNDILNTAKEQGITIEEAKKQLGIVTQGDKDFIAQSKTIFNQKQKAEDGMAKAKQALLLLNNPNSAINDVATVVAFLKTIDPSSVARESEVDSVENARGIIDGIANTFAKMDKGTKLTPTQRQELKDTINTIVNSYTAGMNDYITNAQLDFDKKGLDVTNIIPGQYLNKYGFTVAKKKPQQEMEQQQATQQEQNYTPAELQARDSFNG